MEPCAFRKKESSTYPDGSFQKIRSSALLGTQLFESYHNSFEVPHYSVRSVFVALLCELSETEPQEPKVEVCSDICELMLPKLAPAHFGGTWQLGEHDRRTVSLSYQANSGYC